MRVPEIIACFAVSLLLTPPRAPAAEPLAARIEVHEWYSALAFSRDGRYLLAASDQALVSWELPTGTRRELMGLDAEPLAMEPGPGPADVALVTAAGALLRGNAGVAATPEADPGHASPPAPGGEPLAASAAGPFLVLHDEGAGRLEVRGPGGTSRIAIARPEAPGSVRLAADGGLLAIYGDSGIELHGLGEGRGRSVLPDPGSDDAYALAPDGARVATWSGGTVWFWDPDGNGTWGRLAHTGEVLRVAFAPDGRHALSGSDNGEVMLWDLEGRRVRELRGRDDAAIRGMAMAGDGSVFAIQADDFLELVVPGSDGSAPGTKRVSMPLDLSEAAGGSPGAMAGYESRTRVSRAGAIQDLAANADGGVWIALEDGSVLRVDPDGNEGDPALSEAGPGLRLAADPGGRWLAVGGPGRPLALLGGPEDAGPRALGGPAEGVFGLTLLSGTGLLASASPAGLAFFDPATATRTGALALDGGAIRAMAAFPGGGKLVVGSDDGRVRIVDTSVPRELEGFAAHRGAVTGLAVSPDGRLLATASAGLLDRSIMVFDLAVGAERLRLVGAPRPPGAVGFSADGRHLICGGGPDALLFLDLASGRFVGHLETMPEDLVSLVVGPGGKTLALGSAEGVVEIWDRTAAP